MARTSLTHVLLAILALILLAYAGSALAATPSLANVATEVGLSGQVITTSDTAQFLTVPLGAAHAFVTVETASACFGHNIDGTAPTPTNSGKWLAGTQLIIPNDPLMLKRLRLISCSPGVPATVQIYYSRTRRQGDAQ
jgi:hypothetical protein